MARSARHRAPDRFHPLAVVESSEIGERTRIWHFTHVAAGARIGADCNIGSHCYIEEGVVVGDRVIVKNGNCLWKGVVLEDGVLVGPNVSLGNDRYPRSRLLPSMGAKYDQPDWETPTLVRRGASLGAGCVIVPGVVVGEFAMVGAGAVVTRDVPPFAMVMGNPASHTGWVCRCGKPLSFEDGTACCVDCGDRYEMHDQEVQIIAEQPGRNGSSLSFRRSLPRRPLFRR